jgi:hypothetical protein
MNTNTTMPKIGQKIHVHSSYYIYREMDDFYSELLKIKNDQKQRGYTS